MRFTAPFDYSARFIPSRARQERSTSMKGSVEIEIEEIEAGRARLAFEVGCEQQWDYTNPFPMIDGQPGRVWEIDGVLFSERFPIEELQAVLDAGMDDARNPFNVLDPDTDFVLAVCPSLEPQDRERVERRYPQGLRSWDESAREGVADNIERRAAADIRIVDGMVCVRVSEPCLGIRGGPVGELRNVIRLVACETDPAAASAYVPRHRLSDLCYGNRWRLDRKDEALAAAAAMAARHGVEFIDDTEVRRIDRDAIAFDDDCEALIKVAETAADCLRGVLGLLEREAGMAWYDLQDALEESPGRVTPALALAMERLEVIGDGISLRQVPFSMDIRLHDSSLSSNSRESARERVKDVPDIVAAAMERWRARPRDGMEWVDSGLRTNALPAVSGEAFEVLSMQEARSIGRRMRADVESLAEAARDGLGHLVAVMGKDAPAAVALCVPGDDGFGVQEAVGPMGRPASEAALDRVGAYLDTAAREAEDERALAGLTL